jgi:hypothetical protein
MTSARSGHGGKLVDVPALRSEFIMQIVVHLDGSLDPGHASSGTHRIVRMTGGSFSGPAFSGDVMAGSGALVFVSPDGLAELDIRFALRTTAEQLVFVTTAGLFDMNPAGPERVEKEEAIDLSEHYFRTTLRFEAAAKELRWLTRILAVGVGICTTSRMITNVFAIK